MRETVSVQRIRNHRRLSKEKPEPSPPPPPCPLHSQPAPYIANKVSATTGNLLERLLPSRAKASEPRSQNLRSGSAPRLLDGRRIVGVTLTDMPDQVLPDISTVGAVWAGEWPLPCVSDQVTLKVVASLGSSKQLATHWAAEGGTKVLILQCPPPPPPRWTTLCHPVVVDACSSGGSSGR